MVAAFDTELFGHWWYEGPEFLDRGIAHAAAAGVRLTTLRGRPGAGLVGAPVELPASSWGAGKDWRIWDNDAVAELNDELAEIQKRLFTVLDEQTHSIGCAAAGTGSWTSWSARRCWPAPATGRS